MLPNSELKHEVTRKECKRRIKEALFVKGL